MRFVGLDNYENINCYFITALQILHSSETLTQHLLDGDFDAVKQQLPTLLNPLYVYAVMDGDDAKIAEDVRTAIKLNPPEIRDGYNWISLLNFYYFPLIYGVLGMDDLHKVLEEMSIEKRMIFTDIKPENFKMLPKNEKPTIEAYMDDYRDNIQEIIQTYNPGAFRWTVTALEMYIGGKYGHVAAVIRDGNDLRIYDDHNMDTLYDHFIRDEKKMSNKLRLYYFSKDLISLYENALHFGNTDHFEVNNMSYVFPQFDEYVARRKKAIYRNLSGGNTNQEPKKKANPWCIAFWFLFVLVLIVAASNVIRKMEATRCAKIAKNRRFYYKMNNLV